MTTLFDERERAAEALFALDEELRFLALARRNKMLAAWMCERLHLTGSEAEAYKWRLVEAGATLPRQAGHPTRPWPTGCGPTSRRRASPPTTCPG